MIVKVVNILNFLFLNLTFQIKMCSFFILGLK